jgi:hypothetical protein
MRFSIDATKRAVEHAFANAGLDPLTIAQNTIKELNLKRNQLIKERESIQKKIIFLIMYLEYQRKTNNFFESSKI